MKGQVLTPPHIVKMMIAKLFKKRKPRPNDQVLDAGCGDGAFIRGILEWCHQNDLRPPKITGVELDSQILQRARKSLKNHKTVTLVNRDFLLNDFAPCSYIVCNPPYVRVENIDESKKTIYRENFSTATNRFDLYMLFFEKALRCLAPLGRLVFITPEKFEYTLTSRPLRALMTSYHVAEIHHLNEEAFKGYLTYPTITTIDNDKAPTTIIYRDGAKATVLLPSGGSPWISAIQGQALPVKTEVRLKRICKRISCGIATGRDNIFVIRADKVPEDLKPFSYPTISGKQITAGGVTLSDRILVPYDRLGQIIPEKKLGPLGKYLSNYKKELTSRYCVAKGKRSMHAYYDPEIDDE